MKNSTILFIAAIMLLGISVSNAQTDVNIHLGASIPVSDFGSDDLSDENAAAAGLGFNLGLQYTYQLSPSNGLGLFLGLDLMRNSLQQDVQDELEDQMEQSGLAVEYDASIYTSFPFSAGINYSYPANETIGLFAMGGLPSIT
jgi:hypothetical protein